MPKLMIDRWKAAVGSNPRERRRREVVEVVLAAIASNSALQSSLLLKGGTLMSLAFASPRLTTDVDFTSRTPFEIFNGKYIPTLERAIGETPAKIGYPRLVCKLQSTKVKPSPAHTFPSLEVRIAYAERGSAQAARMATGRGTDILLIEISFNEPVGDFQVATLEDSAMVVEAYGLIETIAEKFRALMQQPVRNRYRRQDVYDIRFLVEKNEFSEDMKSLVMARIVAKSQSRGIVANKESLDDDRIREMAEREYTSIVAETGEAELDFSKDFEIVKHFYTSLPWRP